MIVVTEKLLRKVGAHCGGSYLMVKQAGGAIEVNPANVRKLAKESPSFTVWLLARNPELCKAMIDAGANVNTRDKDGRTALVYARALRNKETVALLKAAGGKR